jgi:hypothetical protein
MATINTPEVIVELEFSNSDARPKRRLIYCDMLSVDAIMEWYGAFYAGDRYFVKMNGEKIKKDINGARVKD